MTLYSFIVKHRDEIDRHISEVLSQDSNWGDEERELWVLNDESLYTWALSQGVDL